MKRTLLIAGLSSLVLSVVLYLLGYSNQNYTLAGTQVQLFPAAFFSLLGLVLLYRAVKHPSKTPEN